MTKLMIFLTLFLLTSIVFILSCNTNDKVIVSPTSNTNITDDFYTGCYDDYIGGGGTCTPGNNHCVHIIKNNEERESCEGTLRIEGYTCTNQYFLCIIPLSETMICDKDKYEVGPKVPNGEYVYSVCCNLGQGSLNVTVPIDPVFIDLNMGCEWNIERQNE